VISGSGVSHIGSDTKLKAEDIHSQAIHVIQAITYNEQSRNELPDG